MSDKKDSVVPIGKNNKPFNFGDSIPEDVISKLRMNQWCIQKMIETDSDGTVDIAKPEDIDCIVSQLVEVKLLWQQLIKTGS